MGENRENKLEKELIVHCAPTLASLKSAGLFRYFFENKERAETELKEVNDLLNERGVYVEGLLWDENAVLVYAYRLNHLKKELESGEAKQILREYGYKEYDVKNCICHLKERLYHYTYFPHEIGLFLGYPPKDVKGFIENEGQNCKCCGLWKVYSDEKKTLQLFQKLEKCSAVYQQVFSGGRKLVQMTVCA